MEELDKKELVQIVTAVNDRLFDRFTEETEESGVNPLTESDGAMKDDVWLPEPIKTLLIAEYNAPEDKKTHIALVKYFNPYGSQTWWFSAYDPESDRFYGMCELFEAELGFASNKEMRELRVPPFGLPIERDIHFTPTPLSKLPPLEDICQLITRNIEPLLANGSR